MIRKTGMYCGIRFNSRSWSLVLFNVLNKKFWRSMAVGQKEIGITLLHFYLIVMGQESVSGGVITRYNEKLQIALLELLLTI